jgi:hypothetical protein
MYTRCHDDSARWQFQFNLYWSKGSVKWIISHFFLTQQSLRINPIFRFTPIRPNRKFHDLEITYTSMNEYKTVCKIQFQHNTHNLANQRTVEVYYNETMLMYKLDMKKLHNNSYMFEISIGKKYDMSPLKFFLILKDY